MATESGKRYADKLTLIGGLDPYEIDKEQWSFDDNLYPSVTYADLFNYLVCTPSPYTTDDLKVYKSLEAYNQFVSGWVREVAVYPSGDLRVVSSRVMHSQKLNDPALKPWIIAKKTGEIQAAHCDCMAGLGEACTHIAATLFFLDAKEKVKLSKTVTQEKAYWLLPSGLKKVPYMSVSDIDFTSARIKKQKLDEAICRTSSGKDNSTTATTPQITAKAITPPTTEELDHFFADLASSNTKPAILSVIPKYSDHFIPKSKDPKLPPPLSRLLLDEQACGAPFPELLQQCVDKFPDISVSKDEANVVEKLTRQQSQSKIWFQMRTGRITASKLKAACCSNPDKPALSLIQSICHPESVRFTSKATNWGCQHEKRARALYHDRMTKIHSKCTLTDSGLILNPQYPHLGASPDGSVNCDCCGAGCVEIKCPFCQRQVPLKDGLTREFCLESVNDRLHLKRNHAYFYQIQCQLFLSEKEYCDFVVFTEKDLHIERILPDSIFWEEVVPKAESFFIKAVMPELVGRFYSSLQPCPVPVSVTASVSNAPEQDVFCYCQGPESGKMIACDNQNCQWKWFHYTCLRMKTAPRGNWFCPDCRKLPQFRRGGYSKPES